MSGRPPVLVMHGANLAAYGFGEGHPFGPDRHDAFHEELGPRARGPGGGPASANALAGGAAPRDPLEVAWRMKCGEQLDRSLGGHAEANRR
ncbi:MAG: hypothetical protein JJT85_00365, partial [Chromatiales bacterium]|nr:hypothetical protein [Chromatiales bacterium]